MRAIKGCWRVENIPNYPQICKIMSLKSVISTLLLRGFGYKLDKTVTNMPTNCYKTTRWYTESLSFNEWSQHIHNQINRA